MNTSNLALLSNRVLKLNVGYLLNAGAGNQKTVSMDITDPIRVSDDLIFQSVSGSIRLSRTKEGILTQTHLTVTVERNCSRCLDAFADPILVEVEELFAYPHPLPETEFSIGGDAKLDLAPLLRAEIIIELTNKKLCQADCKGLCIQCGTNHNHNTCDCDTDFIDPRFAKLKELLDKAE